MEEWERGMGEGGERPGRGKKREREALKLISSPRKFIKFSVTVLYFF